MKLLFLVLLLANAAFIKAQIGIGVVLIDYTDKTIVEFYDKQDGKIVKKINFYDDRANKVWKIKKYETEKIWLKPENYAPLNDMLAFRCLTKENNWMEVVVNNSTGKTYWIKEKEEHIFNDWTKYLQKAACIIRLNAANNLCEQPDEISKTINIKGKDCFSVKSMKGDWLEINIPVEQISDFDKQAKAKSFWLRWKKGNDILIKYTNGT